jgi:hypothetical protein
MVGPEKENNILLPRVNETRNCKDTTTVYTNAIRAIIVYAVVAVHRLPIYKIYKLNSKLLLLLLVVLLLLQARRLDRSLLEFNVYKVPTTC